ncbi:c-type cytochrome [Govanella unica]|uniref:Cytochrome c n=1 Tax=Govanella unica TaxID=2975056 RepID=A0A9X3TZW9_9PROT|nr:hypothetical protein [Govania unica]MDA5195050.1 cytochrome c [Govania unica]
MIRPTVLALFAILTALPAAAQQANFPGVENAQRAWQHWALNCQGCHGPDAKGFSNATPNMAGEVARFLSIPGGRDYLLRVPGVSTSPLNDRDLAELINWMLPHFDPTHMPKDFKPFTAEEIKKQRTRPLRTEASRTRADLITKMPAD